MVAENRPARLIGALGKIQAFDDHIEHFRSPRMDRPTSDIRTGQALAGEDRIDPARNGGPDRRRNFGAEGHLKSMVADFPAHYIGGIRDERAGGGGQFDAAGLVRHDGRRRTIGEKGV